MSEPGFCIGSLGSSPKHLSTCAVQCKTSTGQVSTSRCRICDPDRKVLQEGSTVKNRHSALGAGCQCPTQLLPHPTALESFTVPHSMPLSPKSHCNIWIKRNRTSAQAIAECITGDHPRKAWGDRTSGWEPTPMSLQDTTGLLRAWVLWQARKGTKSGRGVRSAE